MSSPRSDWPVFHFAKANPAGPDQDDVPALLRSVADSIEKLGDIDVSDICLHDDFDADGEPSPSVVVYYWRRGEEDEES
jgi:hypothetical protein